MQSRRFYSGLFLVTLSTLMLQVVQTRILSVALWYHLAFFVISVAMFGLTAGAVWVYLKGDRFTPESLAVDLARYSSALALAVRGFPTGMRMITAVDGRPTPWFWGVNGAAGVLGSTFGLAVSIAFGIGTTVALGGVCYLLLIPAGLSVAGAGAVEKRAADERGKPPDLRRETSTLRIQKLHSPG